MTYLITEIWFYLLCACLLGLLLGWGIWGWTSRRLIMDAKAQHESERLSLKRNFEAEKIALEEEKATAFMARDEALNVKASMISELETTRKASADAKAEINRLVQSEKDARGEFERKLAAMEERLQRERSTAAEAKEAVEAIRADSQRELEQKEAALTGAENAASAAKREVEKTRSDLARFKAETTAANDEALKALEGSLNEERRARAALQAELQQERAELSEAKDAIDEVRADMSRQLQEQQAALAAAESEATLRAEVANTEITRLRSAEKTIDTGAQAVEIEQIRQSMQRTIDDERRAKSAAEADRSQLLGGQRETKAEIERLRAQLAAAANKGQGDSADADRLRRDLEDARQRQSGLEAEVARLRTLLGQREAAPATDAQSPKFTTDAPRPASLFDRRPDVVDDLKEVKGIGPVMERILNENGCYHFKQLANFSKRDIEWISAALESFPDRIERDDWVRQAQTLYLKTYGRRHDAGDVGAIKTLETMS
ncbi:MAG: hypothetical protein ACR2RA_26725 [Geminicoccaceae bacterium]